MATQSIGSVLTKAPQGVGKVLQRVSECLGSILKSGPREPKKMIPCVIPNRHDLLV